MKPILTILITIGIAGCQTSTPAKAGDWPLNQYNSRPAVRHHYQPVKRYRPKTKVIYRTVTRTVVSPGRCASSLTREGDQFATVAGAKDEANKAWMQAVRWKLGEQFMDIAHADNVTYSCGRSSIGSVAGNTFHRCEVTATPCRPPKVSE